MKTNSLAFPKMFNVVQNKVATIEDADSVVNRSRLLFLTDPTEIFNEPEQGVGLKRYLWHYNNENVRAMVRTRIVDQLRVYEPQCNPDGTQFADGNLFTGDETSIERKESKLEMTVSVETKFGAELSDITIVLDK